MLEPCKNHVRHDLIVDHLQRDCSVNIGRQIIDAYALDNYRPSIAMYDTPAIMGKRPDLVAVIQSGLGYHLTAIVEVKRTVGDLFESGPQLAGYLGLTSCLFLAVPANMLGMCISHIQFPGNLRLYKGIINAESGDVVVLPFRQNISVFNEAELLCNIANERRFIADESGLYRLHDIPIRASTPSFTEIDGMTVRSKYADIFTDEMRTGYSSYKDYFSNKNHNL